MSRYLNIAYIKISFSTACYFLSYSCWSVSYMSRVCKFHNFFWQAQKTIQGLYLQALSIAIYGKFDLNVWVLFLAFCIWSVNCLTQQLILVGKLYQLSLWITEHILGISRNLTINLYLRVSSIAIYGNFYLCFFTISVFFGLVNCAKLFCKLSITFWKCQDTQSLFVIEILECI